MLESLRRLWKKGPERFDSGPLKAWAASRDFDYRVVHEGEGCLVEPRSPNPTWRMEWGPSHRSYIQGQELRIIGDVGTPHGLMALVVTRPLMESMERQVFEQYVEDVQTRLDSDTPSEMRWLVMYTKLTGNELGRLRDRFGAVCSLKAWMVQWLSGAFNDALAATIDVVDPEVPLALMIQRGRLTLRTPMPVADPVAAVMWLSVFDNAWREARHIGKEWQAQANETNHSTQPAAWPKSLLPGQEGDAT